MKFSQLRTPGGYVMGEVRSALQKDIRRGNEREALFWASEIDLAGYGSYLFRTLRTITSEDVGLAWPEGPAVIRALRLEFEAVRKEEGGKYPPHNSGGMLYIAHAVIALCRAQKSRVVDNACAVYWVSGPVYRAAMGIEIPDYALDSHTAKGRAMGKTEDSSYAETVRIENESPDVDDPYKEPASKVDRYEYNGGEAKREHNRLMKQLHVMYAELDSRFDGDAHGYAMRLASRRFRRKIKSSAELDNGEARRLLNELERMRAGT